jgi:hypothetical protein
VVGRRPQDQLHRYARVLSFLFSFRFCTLLLHFLCTAQPHWW